MRLAQTIGRLTLLLLLNLWPAFDFAVAQTGKGRGGTISSNGKVITVKGTRFDDRASILRKRGRIFVYINSRSMSFEETGIERIEFSGFGGNDYFRNGSHIPAVAKGGSGDDLLVTVTAKAEFWGNAGNDELLGGPQDDLLFGNPGDDRLVGNSGNDHLDGGSDNDRMFGGAGDDSFFDQSGTNWVSAGSGNDFVQTLLGSDTIFGGDGNDTVRSGDGADKIHGGMGNDTIVAGKGNDQVFGDAGNDRLYGNEGDDTILGWTGNDQLEGGAGNDYLDGGSQVDFIAGGDGQDVLVGSEHDDTLLGGLGNDRIRAGSGVDRVGLSGNFDSYDFSSLGTNSFLSSGPDGKDMFEGAEFYRFADQTVRADKLISKSSIDLMNDVLPDGWTFRHRITSEDVWFDSFSPGGNREFRFRFGSGGAVGNFLDARNGRQLLAPPFRGEVTDRVIQWTMWDDDVRYDHANLTDDNDRFNITQAGTFRNLLSGTVEAKLAAKHLDVWAIATKQWHSELDPHLRGELTSLTRSTRLDGGALLIRRVVRVGAAFKSGRRVTLSNPYFEAWTPFSDAVFNSVALDINGRGQPTKWYADSINVPRYDNLPVVRTRGWAVVYDRGQSRTGVAVGVVFGRDRGLVHRRDGSKTRTSQLVLNLLDFPKGLAVLPGLYGDVSTRQGQSGLPEGSIIDQYILLVPSRGISGSGPQTLDALANLIPGPQIYHPGSSFESSDLNAISNRLRNLRNENAVQTDRLARLLK